MVITARIFIRCFAAINLCIIATSSLAAVTAKLDRTQISLNESVNLIIQGEDDVEIPAAALLQIEKNFDVEHRGNSSQTSCMNFSCTSTVTATYSLSPKNIGLFSIPAMTINNEKTAGLQLSVKAANNQVNSGKVDPVFIETELDRKEAFVQEQVLITFRINNSIELRNLSLEQEFLIDDAIVKLIDNKTYERHINNRPYNTAELTYAIFPQKSGEMHIPAINIEALVSRGGFRSSRMRLRSDSKVVSVKASPITHTDWLPAKDLHFSETWSDDIGQIKVGDSITRTITTTAVGLAAEQIPPLEIQGNSRFKAYPDQAQLEDKHNAQGIVGVRTDTIAIVATKAGEIQLPAIEITWWDVENAKTQTATLPAITLTVVANPEARIFEPKPSNTADANKNIHNTTAPSAIQDQNTQAAISNNAQLEQLWPWQLATAISALLAIVFAALYWRKPPVPAESHQETLGTSNKQLPQALVALKHACAENSALKTRQALLQWAKLQWPRQTVHSTMDIVHISGDGDLAELLKNLDAQLYQGKSTDLDYQKLLEIAQRISNETPQLIANNGRNKQSNNLKPLYPVNS